MIAKSFLSMLFTLVTWTALSQSISTKEFQYYYQVAYDYDIHPPELEYGYPWWFDADSLPVSGIIFLKEDLLAPLEKLNDTAWVARPTSDNAKEILNSSKFQSLSNIFLIPDSSLSFETVRAFVDSLLKDEFELQIKYVGKQGSYCPVSFKRYRPTPDVIICGIGWNWYNINLNRDLCLLINGRLDVFSSISQKITEQYVESWEAKKNYSIWSYKEYDEKYLDFLFKRDSLIFKNPKDSNFFYSERSIHKQELIWFRRYGKLKKLGFGSAINVKNRGDENSVAAIYSVFNEIQKGAYSAKSRIFNQWNYRQLFGLRQFDKLNYIHSQLPDLILDYEEYNNIEEY
jgi:hypothetical protein